MTLINDTITDKLSKNEITNSNLGYYKFDDLRTVVRWNGITL